jgi:hypothetical protein
MTLGKKSPTAIAWLPAHGLALSIPFYFWGFTTTNLLFCAIGLSIGHFVKFGCPAAQDTISQGVVSRSVLAASTAVMLFMINMPGYGLGPPVAGLLSDFFFGRYAVRAGFAGFANAGCHADTDQ